jgi:hypothetical protein
MSRSSSKQELSQAQRELAWIVLVAAVIGLVWQVHAIAPAGAARLRVPVGELRSQAAELELAQREALAGRLPAALLHRHLQQLGEDSARSFAALTQLDVRNRLAEEHALARRSALGIQLELADLAADGAPNPEGAQQLRARLSALEQSLRD